MRRRCWELAGIVGVDPRGMKLWQLEAMAEARMRDAWDHTALVVSVLINLHRGKGRPAIRAEDIHPLRQRRTMTVAEFAQMMKESRDGKSA